MANSRSPHCAQEVHTNPRVPFRRPRLLSHMRVGRNQLSAHPPPPSTRVPATGRGPRGVRRVARRAAAGGTGHRGRAGHGAADGASLAARARLRRHLPRHLRPRRRHGHGRRLAPGTGPSRRGGARHGAAPAPPGGRARHGAAVVRRRGDVLGRSRAAQTGRGARYAGGEVPDPGKPHPGRAGFRISSRTVPLFAVAYASGRRTHKCPRRPARHGYRHRDRHPRTGAGEIPRRLSARSQAARTRRGVPLPQSAPRRPDPPRRSPAAGRPQASGGLPALPARCRSTRALQGRAGHVDRRSGTRLGRPALSRLPPGTRGSGGVGEGLLPAPRPATRAAGPDPGTRAPAAGPAALRQDAAQAVRRGLRRSGGRRTRGERLVVRRRGRRSGRLHQRRRRRDVRDQPSETARRGRPPRGRRPHPAAQRRGRPVPRRPR